MKRQRTAGTKEHDTTYQTRQKRDKYEYDRTCCVICRYVHDKNTRYQGQNNTKTNPDMGLLLIEDHARRGQERKRGHDDKLPVTRRYCLYLLQLGVFRIPANIATALQQYLAQQYPAQQGQYSTLGKMHFEVQYWGIPYPVTS